MSDIEITWGDDPRANQAAVNRHVRDLHEKVANGERTRAELSQQVERMAADLKKADEAVRDIKMRNSIEGARRASMGSDAELRQFVQTDGTQGGERIDLWTTRQKFAGQDVGPTPGLLDSDVSHGEWHQRAKDLAEAAFLAATIKGTHRAGRSIGKPTARHLREHAAAEMAQLGAHLRRGPGIVGRLAAEAVERVFNDTNGTGGEFIPDQILLPELERAVVLGNFGLAHDNIAVMNITNRNVTMPFLETAPRPYKYGAATVDDPANFTSSTPGTSERDITPVGMAISVPIDRDAAEDVVFGDVMPVMREIVARAASLGREDAIINGDTAGSHQDAIASWNPNDLFAGTGGGSGDHRRLYLGLRARAFDIDAAGSSGDATLDTGTGLTYDEILTLAGKMGAGQALDGDLALIVDHKTYLEDILGISEVRTLDKYGPQASVLSGEVGRVGPWRILRTPVLDKDLAATGLYTGSGALAGAVGVNLARYRIARRRALRVEMATEIRNGMLYLVATCRETLHDLDNGASIGASPVNNVVYAYNI